MQPWAVFASVFLSATASVAVASSMSYGVNRVDTGPMLEARFGHSATLLRDGRVLLIGGSGVDPDGTIVPLRSAEIYDPATDRFTATGAPSFSHIGHDARTLLLHDGSVLICEGTEESLDRDLGGPRMERYYPDSGTFLLEPPMSHPRTNTTTALLPDGRVLLVGGDAPIFQPAEWTSKAEIYDPVGHRFDEVGEAGFYRTQHSVTTLQDGRVLIAGGGCSSRFDGDGDFDFCSSAELYDPQTNTFAPTGSMTVPRYAHRATLLADGRVLITGGYDNHYGEDEHSSLAAEIYDPATGTFRKIANVLSTPRANHTATALPGGQILLAGGNTGTVVPSASPLLEAYDDTGERFLRVGKLLPEVGGVLFSTATSLTDGRVLIAGGYYPSRPGSPLPGAVNKAGLYDQTVLDSIFGDGFDD